MLVAVPLSAADAKGRLNSGTSDFIRNWYEARYGLNDDLIWDEYQRVADYAGLVMREAKDAGVRVIPRATTDDWHSALASRPVCTMFAHWVEPDAQMPGQIEFDDRIVTVPELLACTPASFRGMVDLTICKSVHPGNAFKAKFRRSTVVMNSTNIELGGALAYYRQVVRLLARGDCEYCEAYTQVTLAAMSVI
jgi:hypothetical protein